NSYLDLVMKEAAKKHSISIDELKRGGYRIVVNIDKQAQKIAYEEFKKDRYFPGNTDGVEGAFVMLEEATGQVKVALGGRDYQLGDLNRVTVKRQPGSTFKPLAVYGPAMMTEEYEPYSLLKDEELAYGDYVARNYEDRKSTRLNSSHVSYTTRLGSEEATGQVKVAVGGRDYQLGDLNRVTVKRQPGSTFKPLAVYGPAMMTEEYEPYSLLKDEELAYGDYVARNY